jgi:hypothetical protein
VYDSLISSTETKEALEEHKVSPVISLVPGDIPKTPSK